MVSIGKRPTDECGGPLLAHAPTASAAPTGSKGRWNLHPHQRCRFVRGAPAGEQEPPSDVDVLGSHRRVEAPHLLHCLSAEDAEHARHHADPSRHSLSPADQTDDRSGLENLHRAEKISPVGDVRPSGDGSEQRRATETSREPPDGLRVEVGVGVDNDHEVVLGGAETLVQASGLASIDVVGKDFQARVVSSRRLRDRRSPIERAVVEKEHLKDGIVGSERRFDTRPDHPLLVDCRDEDRHAGPDPMLPEGFGRLVREAEDKRTTDPQNGRDDRIETDEEPLIRPRRIRPDTQMPSTTETTTMASAASTASVWSRTKANTISAATQTAEPIRYPRRRERDVARLDASNLGADCHPGGASAIAADGRDARAGNAQNLQTSTPSRPLVGTSGEKLSIWPDQRRPSSAVQFIVNW